MALRLGEETGAIWRMFGFMYPRRPTVNSPDVHEVIVKHASLLNFIKMPSLPMVFTLFNIFKLACSKYEEGEITINEKWVFIARFCFLSEDGQFEYSIQYDKIYAPINLLLYYDSDQQWPAVYKSNKTCEQRESVLNRRLNQIITLTKADFSSGCTEVLTNQNRTHLIQCHQGRRFQSSRERWWFLAVSNCNSTKGLSLKYRFLMTNGAEGDYWHEHFSADEFYILPVLMSYCIVYILLVLAVITCAMELKSRQLYHTTYKLFAVSVYLQELGIFIQSIAYVRYAVDGVGVPRLRNVGRFCESASEVIFLLLLLLLAKGYTITRGRLRLGSSVKLTIFMCMYVIMYITLFIYERLFFDPGEVLYLYESPAGYGLVILRIVAWWMFIYSTVFTLKHYPEKSSFYYPFNLVGTMWFVAGPAFILAANTLIDKWVRESIVCAVQHFIALAGHILFLILTVPNKANKNFPYHVRTTQIGIMEMTNGVSGNNTIDHFGHHPYAPGGPTFPSHPWSRVPIELFTISSPAQSHRTHLGRRFKIQETIDERAFSPENLIIRPEEVLPTPTGVVNTSLARVQPINLQPKTLKQTNPIQLGNSLDPTNTLEGASAPHSLEESTLTPKNLGNKYSLIGLNEPSQERTATPIHHDPGALNKPNGVITIPEEGGSSDVLSAGKLLTPKREMNGWSFLPKITQGSSYFSNEPKATTHSSNVSNEPKATTHSTNTVNNSKLPSILQQNEVSIPNESLETPSSPHKDNEFTSPSILNNDEASSSKDASSHSAKEESEIPHSPQPPETTSSGSQSDSTAQKPWSIYNPII